VAHAHERAARVDLGLHVCQSFKYRAAYALSHKRHDAYSSEPQVEINGYFPITALKHEHG